MTHSDRRHRPRLFTRVTPLLVLAVMLAASASLASTQEQPDNNKDAVHENLEADTRMLVAKYMVQ